MTLQQSFRLAMPVRFPRHYESPSTHSGLPFKSCLSLDKSYLSLQELGSPLAACSMYRDLTCYLHHVHTVNNLCMFNCQFHFYLCNRGPYVRLSFVPNMLSSSNKVIIIIIMLIHGIGRGVPNVPIPSGQTWHTKPRPSFMMKNKLTNLIGLLIGYHKIINYNFGVYAMNINFGKNYKQYRILLKRFLK